MDPHEEFFRSLPPEEIHLVALKEFLYEGSWGDILKDLVARKEGKPHVYKLETRIDEDLARIEKLVHYEKRTGVNLGKYLHVFKAKT
ncbi:MAG: hypothetical protein O7J95_02390 [Planctomycetota bacterium]|nr:hypothetical protein [Planctomycetota bacterium]